MKLGTYKNGNYYTTIYLDGTRIRENDENVFSPEFAECMDVQISNRCSNGCEWCYAGCTPDGQMADFKKYKKLLDSIHPYTELAININFPVQDDFEEFLQYMKDKDVIVNATISQIDFMKHQVWIHDLVERRLIYGIGVSYLYPDKEFIYTAVNYRNLVLHVINGIVSEQDIILLKNKGLKLLVLGYKDVGRGTSYHNKKNEKINENQLWMRNNVEDVFHGFGAVGFDNLALEQLYMKRFFTEEEWKRFYSGDEGEFSFYLDLVKDTFSTNSLSEPLGKIEDKTADEMFHIVRQHAGF